MKTEFHTKHTKHYIALVIFLLATAISGFILFNDTYYDSPPLTNVIFDKNEENNDKNVYNTVDKNKIPSEDLPKNTSKSIDNSIQIEDKPQIESPEDEKILVPQDLPETPKEVTEEIDTVHATLTISGTSYNIDIPDGSTAYDLMNTLRENGSINFTAKNFGGNLGMFVQQINGIENGTDNKYWIYYINGSEAKIGISNYTLNSNDIIEWKYEESTF